MDMNPTPGARALSGAGRKKRFKELGVLGLLEVCKVMFLIFTTRNPTRETLASFSGLPSSARLAVSCIRPWCSDNVVDAGMRCGLA